jgi:hypothetical protein
MSFSATSRNARPYGALPCAVLLVVLSGCTSVATVQPATPTLLGITGNGSFNTQNNQNSFIFNTPTYAPGSVHATHYVTSVVRFTVPYPTSIELSIKGKPLTKQDPPLTTNYEYSGAIENPGQNPATWRVEIKTPFDVPYFRTYPTTNIAYVLTIVDVSGSQRSAPLTINYLQPWFIPPSPIVGTSSQSRDTPSITAGRPGPCAGGAAEQSFRICFRNPPQLPHDITVQACSYAQAVNSLTNAYGPNHAQGAC